MAEQAKPDTPSSDWRAMEPYWTMAGDLLEGADAVRDRGEAYLPRLPGEDIPAYEYRRRTAKFTNIFADIVENLAAKPFRKEIALTGTASARLKTLAEDIDGSGNSLHVFAASTFFSGIAYAIDWILVDYTKARAREDGRALSIAEEREQGLRPYWVRIAAKDMIAVQTASIGGREQFVHVRFREHLLERQGFAEEVRERIRVFDRVRNADGTYGGVLWQVFERRAEGRNQAVSWQLVDSGTLSIPVIPLAPFIAGRRKAGSWQFVPPMLDVAHLQIEHYQQEADLKNIRTMTAFPMLAGIGVQPPQRGETLQVGPRSVLYAPAMGDGRAGEWKFIEPQGNSLKFLADSIDKTEQQMRELGRQPLTAQTGNLTVVTTAFAASKANSVISAWALNLKDALERALEFTAMWLGEEPTGEVDVESEFDVEIQDDKSLDALLKMREGGDLSQEGIWGEMKRRGVLAPEFDPARERRRLLEELPDPDDEAELGAAVVPLRPGAAR